MKDAGKNKNPGDPGQVSEGPKMLRRGSAMKPGKLPCIATAPGNVRPAALMLEKTIKGLAIQTRALPKLLPCTAKPTHCWPPPVMEHCQAPNHDWAPKHCWARPVIKHSRSQQRLLRQRAPPDSAPGILGGGPGGGAGGRGPVLGVPPASPGGVGPTPGTGRIPAGGR